MSKIRLGGIKAFENRAYLTSLCRPEEDAVADICARLAADRININLLTHIADNGLCESITAACTESSEAFSSYVAWKVCHGACSVGKLLTDISMISVFPHDQKLDVIGSLIKIVGGYGIRSHGFASSPSSITILAPSSDFQSVIEGLFDAFEFPTYKSPLDWHAAYHGQEGLLKEIVCSYQEQIIKVYDYTHQIDLDLWTISLPLNRLCDLGAAFLELDALQCRMPFLVSRSSPDGENMCFAFCLAGENRDKVTQVIEQRLPDFDRHRDGPVSVFFVHGPHFGDRFGIINALVGALRRAGIPVLSMSCAVSSMSFVVPGNDSNHTIEALKSSFQVPAGK
jgi:aspartokinase